jgi:hypothetical protein
MRLFQVIHADKPPTVISAAALVVHEGFLHALRYSGNYQPGGETEASWAPGTWLEFRRAPSCPTCGKQQNAFD